jgi:hypothetical protein
MPIRPFLNGERFDQETVRILGVAFEQVCIGFGSEIATTTSSKRQQTRSSRLRKPASAILIYCARGL